jgi:chorismate mutase
MNNKNQQFYLVDIQILSEAIKKTIRTKELLKRGEAETINDAVKKTGISRSAYYKYKDHVAPAIDMSDEDIITLVIVMGDDISLFTKILRKISKGRNKVLSVNRSLTAKKTSVMTVSFETAEMKSAISKLVTSIGNIKGVKKVDRV